jgi:hypothetical protein
MSSLTQKPGIKNRIRPSRTWIKVKNPNAPAASRALDRSFQECRSPFRLLPFLESAFCFLLAHRNDISPRWASTDAKINSVSPGNGTPSDSNARISETANTP